MLTRAARFARERITLTMLGWVMLGVAALGMAWIVVTGLMARATLQDVRRELPRLRAALSAGDLRTARALVARIEHQTAFARDLTTGPAWWVGAQLPVVGTPLRTGREITAQLDTVGRVVLPGVTTLSSALATFPAPQHGRIDLAALERLEPTLSGTAQASTAAARRLRSADPSWLPAVSDARRRLLTELERISTQVSGADDTLRLLLPLLGRDGPKRYFVGIMNEAEARGLGGLPGSYAVALADRGSITFEKFGSDDDLLNVPAGVDLGAQYRARYGTKPTTDFRDSTASPDFRDAARIWAGMWQRKTGQRIDGAIALDPTALSYVLAVSGPFTSKSGAQLTAANVVSLTQQRQYRLFPGNTRRDKLRRKQFLEDLARGASTKITSGTQPRRLIKALGKAARNRRLLVWSADADLERQLIDLGWAGILDAQGRTFTGFTISNASGSKLDYYVQRAFSYVRPSCASGASATATMVLHSRAPTTGLPPYVTIRLDRAPPGARVGDELLLVTYYATPGARITRITVDGRPVIAAQLPERGLTTVQTRVEMKAGGTVRVQVSVAEPAGARGPVTVLRQPLAHDASVSVRSCG